MFEKAEKRADVCRCVGDKDTRGGGGDEVDCLVGDRAATDGWFRTVE